jgi:hypothetical protein
MDRLPSIYMDDMSVQGISAVIIIYGGIIAIAIGILFVISKFWSALVSGDTGFILWWGPIIFASIALYGGSGLLLRRFGKI